MWACEDDVVEAVLLMMAPHWEAALVENETGNPGFPDVVYSARRIGTGFMEFKFVQSLQHEQPTRIGLKREQADFLMRHGEMGGRCHIMLGSGRGRDGSATIIPTNELYLFGWEHARFLLELSRPRQFLTYGKRVQDTTHLLNLLGDL